MFAVLWAVFVVQPRWQVAGAAWLLLVVRWCRGSSDDPGGSESQLRMVPAKERSIAVGYFNVGSSIGAILRRRWWYGQS